MDLDDELLKLETPILYAKTQISSSSARSKNKYQELLIKAIELILSVSLLSVLLSFFTGLSFLRSYTYYFSKLLLPLLTQAFERKYMFLLCNGILVFLARKSGFAGAFSSSPRPSKQSITLQPSAVDSPLYGEELAGTYAEAVDSPYSVSSSMMVEQEKEELGAREEPEEEEGEENKGQEEEEEEDYNKASAAEEYSEKVEFIIDDDDQEEQMLDENDESESVIIAGGDGENADTESEGPPSNTEELNKKIEEFIRKMKEELRLEAQQQQLIPA